MYDMNDFTVDKSNIFVKSNVEIKIYNKNTEKIELHERYLIISDSIVLLFIPDTSRKNSAKLIFYSNLSHIDKLISLDIDKETEKIINKNSKNKDKIFLRFKIIWKESDIYIGNISSYDNTFLMQLEDFGIFNEKLIEKRGILLNSTELFSEDYMKYSCFDSLKSFDESKLVEITMYLESNFMKMFEIGDFINNESQSLLKEQSKEIVFFYQKLVEILSEKNDANYIVYMTKMQNFLEIAKSFLEDVKENNFQLFDQSFG